MPSGGEHDQRNRIRLWILDQTQFVCAQLEPEKGEVTSQGTGIYFLKNIFNLPVPLLEL